MLGSNGILYGPQAPVVPEQKLMWVTDLRDPGRGPALHFQTAYDKVVIFEGSSFPAPEWQAQKRDTESVFDKRHDTMPADQGQHNHRFANSPGETPWYCYWNQTFLEGFVYIQQPVHGAETQQYAVSTSMIMSKIIMSTATVASMHSLSLATPTTFVRAPIATSTSIPQQQLQPRATSLPMPPAPAVTQAHAAVVAAPATQATPPPSRFPFIVKLEERRLPNPAFTPFCQRMRVLADGRTIPLTDNGNPVVEFLREAPANKVDAQVTAGVIQGQSGHSGRRPMEGVFMNGRSESRRVRRGESWPAEPRISGEWNVQANGKIVKRNQEPGNSCHCVWVSPYG
jgi:hypothetical protein